MVALLVDTSIEGARKALEKASEVVREEEVQGPEGPLDLTISAGLAALIEVETLEHAIAEADRFLLLARARGGDQILDSGSDEGAIPRSILLLEDDELVAFLAKQRLGRAGFEVTHVRSAGEAREHPTPDLWVLDTSLPDASLDELLPELRQRSPAPLLAVIPAGDRGILKRAIELGADDFIVRPFDPLELQIRAQRLLKSSAVLAKTI
jgi:PleD family two-component response regulator